MALILGLIAVAAFVTVLTAVRREQWMAFEGTEG